MKTFVIVFFIIFILTTGLGIFIFNEVSKNINLQKPNINKKILNLSNNKISPISISEDSNTIIITENQLKQKIEPKTYGIFSQFNINFENERILLNGKGKKIINYSFDAQIIPTVNNNRLYFEIESLKILGIANSFLKKQIEQSINKEINKEINNRFIVYNVTIINNQIVITGEKR